MTDPMTADLWRRSGRAMKAACPRCGHIHASDDARAVGRFRSQGAEGYRARSGGPLRAKRAEATDDECQRRVADR
jgi:hypothetical protein